MSASEILRAVAYVDGGCFPNPGRAGWAAVLMTGEDTRELMGGEENSTNQRAEILGAIAALEALDEPTELEIVSDSMYLIMCARREWKRRTNRDLWARLDAAAAPHDVTYTWVRGHAGNPGNERAHELAVSAIGQGAA
jgi:ribonuclease HI